MQFHRLLRAAALGALALIGGRAVAAPPHLTMTCHELVQGVPMKAVTIYAVVGPHLLRTAFDGERLIISTENVPRYLSTTHDGRTVEESYASHVLSGSILTRTVVRGPTRGGPMRAAFTERYDFARQSYTSSFDPHDACHHDGRVR